jgi:hypothetical protein
MVLLNQGKPGVPYFATLFIHPKMKILIENPFLDFEEILKSKGGNY